MRSGTAAWSQDLFFNWQPASHGRRKQIASLLNTQTRYWYNNSGQAAGSGAVSLSHTDKSVVHIQAGCECLLAIRLIYLARAGCPSLSPTRAPLDPTLLLPLPEGSQLNNSFAFLWWGLANETSKIACSIFVSRSSFRTPRQPGLPLHVTYIKSSF